MILKESTYCVPGFKKITLLYTIVPTGVGGHLFHVTIFCSKIGLRDTREPTEIGHKIPQNGQKLLKFGK